MNKINNLTHFLTWHSVGTKTPNAVYWRKCWQYPSKTWHFFGFNVKIMLRPCEMRLNFAFHFANLTAFLDQNAIYKPLIFDLAKQCQVIAKFEIKMPRLGFSSLKTRLPRLAPTGLRIKVPKLDFYSYYKFFLYINKLHYVQTCDIIPTSN